MVGDCAVRCAISVGACVSDVFAMEVTVFEVAVVPVTEELREKSSCSLCVSLTLSTVKLRLLDVESRGQLDKKTTGVKSRLTE